jgi:hypothetical protein
MPDQIVPDAQLLSEHSKRGNTIRQSGLYCSCGAVNFHPSRFLYCFIAIHIVTVYKWMISSGRNITADRACW